MKKIMSKYDYEYRPTDLDYSEVVTVPDQVLSMKEIYEKYAVRGDINGLANGVRPVTRDNLDPYDEAVDFVPEDDLDILQRSHYLRQRQQEVAVPPADDSKKQNKESSEETPSKPDEKQEQKETQRSEGDEANNDRQA